MVHVAHPLLSVWAPSILSAWLDKSVYFLLGETALSDICATSISIQYFIYVDLANFQIWHGKNRKSE